jgi:hypothetical protein
MHKILPNANNTSRSIAATGLKAALNILSKWGCSPEQQWNILGMKRATYYKNNDQPEKANLSNDQIERLSYLLNIHAALRVVYDNPVNVYGFMSMSNDNPFFNGRSPLDIISTGNFGYLYETFKRVDVLRSGGW